MQHQPLSVPEANNFKIGKSIEKASHLKVTSLAVSKESVATQTEAVTETARKDAASVVPAVDAHHPVACVNDSNDVKAVSKPPPPKPPPPTTPRPTRKLPAALAPAATSGAIGSTSSSSVSIMSAGTISARAEYRRYYLMRLQGASKPDIKEAMLRDGVDLKDVEMFVEMIEIVVQSAAGGGGQTQRQGTADAESTGDELQSQIIKRLSVLDGLQSEQLLRSAFSVLTTCSWQDGNILVLPTSVNRALTGPRLACSIDPLDAIRTTAALLLPNNNISSIGVDLEGVTLLDIQNKLTLSQFIGLCRSMGIGIPDADACARAADNVDDKEMQLGTFLSLFTMIISILL